MFFLLAFPLVLIILIYLGNPITHLTASSLHKITKKKNHTTKSSNFKKNKIAHLTHKPIQHRLYITLH